MIIGFQLFGTELPLWALFLIGVIAVIIAWKLVKFALKIMLILVVFFVILMGIDYFNVISMIQNFISNIT